MTYDFSKLTDRRHTNSLKWDIAPHELPMWVANMDFETAPEIIAAITHWWEARHQFSIEKEWIL